MKHLLLISALIVGSEAGDLVAQQNIVYHPNNTISTAKNAFPFGAAKTGVRQQSLVPGSVLGMTPVLIQDIYAAHLGGIAATNTLTEGEVVYGDFEIRIGITPLATLTTTWATNLPNPTVVQKGRLRMRWKAGAWTPLGLQQPFLWAPTSANDNLCVDLILWNLQDAGGLIADANGYVLGCSFDASVQRVYLLGWPVAQPATGNVGTSGPRLAFLLGNGSLVGRGNNCLSSANTSPAIGVAAGTWPKLGASFQLELNAAGANKPAFALLGTSEIAWGATSLPIDLTLIGGTGCTLWIDPLVTLGATVTSPTGFGTTTIPVPNVALFLGARLYATWATLDAVNGLGVVPSDYGLLMLGQ